MEIAVHESETISAGLLVSSSCPCINIRHMSRSGNCYDNAYLESFFGTLKTELVHGERYRTRLEARLSIFEYVEVFYNRQRRHSALGYRSPEQYERLLNET